MAKIIKNSFGNFLVIFVIFSLVTGWFFSGWPRIWPLGKLGVNTIWIPPEIQEARADTATNSPGSNSGSNWTNPTNAYADGTNAATQTSGSGANIYSGYGFNLSGNTITQVRVRTDAWSTGIGGTTKSGNASANTNGTLPWTNPTYGYTSNNQYATVSPTYGATTSQNPTATTNGTNPWTNPDRGYTSNNQYANTTAFSSASPVQKNPDGSGGDPDSNTIGATHTGSYFYSEVDEPTTPNDADYYTMVTNSVSGRLTMTASAFSLPSNAGITSVVIYYRGTNSGNASFRPSLKIGSTYYDALGTVRDPSTWTTYSDTFTTNPKTSAAWQVSELNRSGGDSNNYLNAFGTASTDCNPDNQISWLYLEVNYYTVVSYDQLYSTFGLSDPISGSTITKVEVGYEAFTSVATGQLDLYTSENGGSSWNPIHTTGNLGTSDPGAYTYVDVTSDDSSWTWTELNNTNFKVKVVSYWISGNITWSLDALVVRITYNDTRGYDQIYGTFGITGTTETISAVEVGYEAFAIATGKLDIYTSSNGGSSWSSVHTTANLATSDPGAYTYVDVTSDYAWTWTLLNNSNLKVKVVSNYVSGTPAWSLDALVVRVTYTTLTDDQIRVAVSWDGGSNWSSNYDTNLSGSETTYWTDVTAATTWTPTKLNDSNFRVSVSSVTVGDTSTVNLDWLPVEVTYTAIVYSVTVEPTSVNYGVMPINDTKASGIITATVGDAATKLNIKGVDATYTEGGKCGDGVCTWTLSAAQGTDAYVHAFTKNTGLASGGTLGSNPATQWVALTKISDENILAASVVANGSQDFKLDMRTPSAAGGETELGKSYSTDVTIVASAP